MKIATSNKLAHYQVEYQELTEQTAMLQSQLAGVVQQAQSMACYLQMNGGDRKAQADYRALIKRKSSIEATIRRNSQKMVTLQRRMAVECGGRPYAGRRRYY